MVFSFLLQKQFALFKKILTKGTLTTLKSALNVVKQFMGHLKIKTLYFDDINRKFYNEFIDYLTNEKNTPKTILEL
ncbi:phage integrase SAM-like domain-containing protein [Flavobacterium myungsuense]|uniref:phage integrase SAM-like domain-containing protein n=1 Tax=Flavobacterium myungsuense TaxID=651823 RepID=UPI003637EE05